MRKVLLWGDEGSGKSTIAALLARYAVAGGTAVLLIDAGGDPAMHRLLGLPRPKMTLVEEMGGADYVRRSYPCDRSGSLAPDLPVDSLPLTCMSRRDNLALLSLGAESLARVGARPLGQLFREFLGRLDDTGWWVFIDGGHWLEESGEAPFEVIDAILQVDVPDAGGVLGGGRRGRGLFEGYGLPLFSVANRVSSPCVTGDPVPRACFPDEGPVLPVRSDGRGMSFPSGFLMPIRRLWDSLISDLGSARTSRQARFRGGSALRG